MTSSEAVTVLFGEAVELPVEKRPAFVDASEAPESVKREVLELLVAHEESAADPEALDPELAAALVGDELADVNDESEAERGRLIGPYRILRRLGRGGMGVVYLAERADGAYDQQVALKLLPPSVRSEALMNRFALERQILARLEHPGIARLLDGGASEHGEPFLVMEYVAGEPLTRWCDRHRLSVRRRLELFLDVCEAIGYAHGRLVVHRDLKPSNILVTDHREGRAEQVKLLDFGIAKLLAEDGDVEATALTQLGLRPYTPGYAAPEQRRGDAVTVATDVYGLGVLLYELLSGHRPDTGRGEDWTSPARPSTVVATTAESDADATTAEQVASQRASHPDRLRRRLAGDLDTIALKALREEPEGRYGSVQALAEDVRRHLEGLPIGARPAGAAYRLRKFVARHRVGVAGGALLVIAVLAGLAGTVWQARVAERERDAAQTAAVKAQAEAAKAEQVARFLAGVFRLANPLESKGEEMTVRQALDRGSERIEDELSGQPVVQAELMMVLGGTYLELGDYDRAEELLTAALHLRREHLAPDDPEVAAVLRRIGVLRYHQGNYAEAIRTYLSGAQIVERSFGSESLELAGFLNNLGFAYGRTRDYEKGIETYERALAIHELHPEADPVELGKLWLNLGTLHSDLRQDDRALAAYEQALAIYERELGPDHPLVAGALGNISSIRMRHGDFDGLEEMIRRMLAIHRKAYGPVHDRVGAALKILGDFLASTGREDEAIDTYLQGIEVDRQASGETHPVIAYPLHALADVHLNAGRPAAALPYLREAVALREAALEPDNPQLLTSLTGLGNTLASLQRYDEAEGTLRRALAGLRIATDPNQAQVASAAVDLAGVLIERGRCSEALLLLTEAESTYRTADPIDDKPLAKIETLLVRCSSEARAP